MCHYYFERKNDKVLSFIIVYFPNCETRVSFQLALQKSPSNKRRTSQFQSLISAGGRLLEEIRQTFFYFVLANNKQMTEQRYMVRKIYFKNHTL